MEILSELICVFCLELTNFHKEVANVRYSRVNGISFRVDSIGGGSGGAMGALASPQ